MNSTVILVRGLVCSVEEAVSLCPTLSLGQPNLSHQPCLPALPSERSISRGQNLQEAHTQGQGPGPENQS